MSNDIFAQGSFRKQFIIWTLFPFNVIAKAVRFAANECTTRYISNTSVWRVRHVKSVTGHKKTENRKQIKTHTALVIMKENSCLRRWCQGSFVSPTTRSWVSGVVSPWSGGGREAPEVCKGGVARRGGRWLAGWGPCRWSDEPHSLACHGSAHPRLPWQLNEGRCVFAGEPLGLK